MRLEPLTVTHHLELLPARMYRGYNLRYSSVLNEERVAAMLHVLEARILHFDNNRLPAISRIELHPHTSMDENVLGIIIVVFENQTQVFEYRKG